MGGKLIYAKPSFLEGVARIFDFGGTLDTYYYLEDENQEEADARAVTSDWDAVGKGRAGAIGWYVTYNQPVPSPKSDSKSVE